MHTALDHAAWRAAHAPEAQKRAAANRLLFDLRQYLNAKSKEDRPVKIGPLLIGLTGLPASGKDTVARILVRNYAYATAAFADALRDEVCVGWNRLDDLWLTDRVIKERPTHDLAIHKCPDADFMRAMLRANQDMRAPRSPRQILQLWGTEYRRTQRPSYWIERLTDRVDELVRKGNKRVVISDVRFPNEADFVRSRRGELWKLHRVYTLAASEHVSDTALQGAIPDVIVHNHGSLEQLEIEINRIIQTSQPRRR
jgi:hypothetical protein